MTTILLSVRALEKRFGEVCAVQNFSLNVATGSVVSILAPSGAGKTTLLRLIAGLELPTRGVIEFNGKILTGPSSHIGFVFQEPAAFPWLTVMKNVIFGLNLNANSSLRMEAGSDVALKRLVADLGLDALLDRYPSQLSGGQRQRVVIARSLLLRPLLLLCDEPFSALDEATRQDLRELLLDICNSYKLTLLFVTHSIDEALFLGNEVLVCSGPPLRIVSRRSVPFTAPRSEAILHSPLFLRIRDDIRQELDSGRSR